MIDIKKTIVNILIYILNQEPKVGKNKNKLYFLLVRIYMIYDDGN